MVFFARLKAGLLVLLLMGGLIGIGVLGTQMVGNHFSQANATQHAQGKIIKIMGPEKDFQLLLADKRVLSFHCGTGCRASLSHMQRHLTEKATTDVYYLITPGQGKQGQQLQAVSVD
ncbi:hypothetical protein [Ktedonospora formicarum]|uniref:Uncharacterized protein n=1 Tax=Ktedonospora formicarum TaxID=2778364 RepID=A0A8J3MRV5_9CHLR|nr:hypothetical protein [Ktedonospora formicarum]GHO44201.1 hypothetical protein KSX_23640 [Ktedonospora formicarum]